MANRSAVALGEIIRQQRELAELSMRQFAQLAGISNPYLSQIERGLRAPSEQVLEGIARALKLSSDALYEQAGMPSPGEQDESNAVLDAVAADPRLTARQRSALKEVYEAFVASSPRQRPRRADAHDAADATDAADVPDAAEAHAPDAPDAAGAHDGTRTPSPE
jgi:transcriptional regulator with XRE-family HTH domain